MSENPQISHFNNHTDAALYACRMRADGHRAYLLDEATSWLWGPLAVGGVRVAVYQNDDEPAEVEEIPEPPGRNIFPDFVGIVAVAFVSMGLISLMVLSEGRVLYHLFVFVMKFLVLPSAVALLLMPFFISLTHHLREPGSLLRLYLGILALITLFNALLLLNWSWS